MLLDFELAGTVFVKARAALVGRQPLLQALL